jgi:uncharacterized protein YutD
MSRVYSKNLKILENKFLFSDIQAILVQTEVFVSTTSDWLENIHYGVTIFGMEQFYLQTFFQEKLPLLLIYK